MRIDKLKDALLKTRVQFKGWLDDLKDGGKTVVITMILAIFIMGASCLAVFFIAVQGAEKVMVPDVRGKSLAEAQLELQAKELYPRIQLKYSEIPGDKGTILDQNPVPGAIVKAYRSVNLTVSRGVPIDYMEDYSGRNIDEVLNAMELLFSGANSSVEIFPPVYQKSEQAVGTILVQYPPEGTPIEENTGIQFVVSSGMEIPKTEVPDIKGLSIRQLLARLKDMKVVFDFDLEEDSKSPADGIISEVESAGKKVEYFSRVNAVLKIQPLSEKSQAVQGIFSAELPEYPYPVPVRLDSQDQNGKCISLAEFCHPGNHLTIPYSVKKGTVLMLYVLDEEYMKVVVE
ncbi:PASTA domain-containing protein [Treponema sp.]|uniref:PASTA domain-containing protein n=1 Tax=Treponema sp. TaxID=166 RepID=UPI003EFD432D